MRRAGMLATSRRALARSLIVLGAAVVLSAPLYALAQSGLAPTLARALNVSVPLILLNELVEGGLPQLDRGRDGVVALRGLLLVARGIGIIAILVGVVAAIQYAAGKLRPKRAVRTRVR